jgi:glycerophosphoryl diester phosphodiesterase
MEPPHPAVIAHRGFSGRWPENTLAAVRGALRCGVDYVEVDVHETRDGKLVVVHDYNLRRCGGVRQRVRDLTLRQLRAYCPSVPTLRAVLRACRGRARVLVEIKRATPSKVATEIERCGMQRQVVVFTLSEQRLREFATAAPAIPRFALVANRLPTRPAELPVTVRGIGASRRLITSAAMVDAVHAAGWQLFVWTVNRPADIARFYAWGVDGVITNHPDRAKLVLRQRPRRLSSANSP